jgi:hypothetical protein
MVNIANGKSRLGCTVSKKFSAQFAADVSWSRISGTSAATDEDTEDDITQGNENTETPAQGGDNAGGGDSGIE